MVLLYSSFCFRKYNATNDELQSTKTSEAKLRETLAELENLYSDKYTTLRSSSEKQITVLEEGLRAAETRLSFMTEMRDEVARTLSDKQRSHQEEFQQLESRLNEEIETLKKEREDLLSQRESSTRLIADLTAKLNAAEVANIALASKAREEEIAALTSERDSLLKIIEQQRHEHENIQRMSQASLRMLQQRQSVLDNISEETVQYDGVLKLQDTIQALLNREGNILQSEMSSAQRLTEMIASTRQTLQKLMKEKGRDENSKSIEIPSKNDELLNELNFYKKAVEDAEASAEYWKSVAEKSVTVPEDKSSFMGSEEIAVLRKQLEIKSQELDQAKRLMSKSQLEMQHEFASLWLAVQQLGRVDTAKDQALAEIVAEKEQIVREKHEIHKKLRRLRDEHRKLKEEIRSIDEDILRAVDAEGISLDDLLGSNVKLPIEVNSVYHYYVNLPVLLLRRDLGDFLTLHPQQ